MKTERYSYRFPIGDWSGDGHSECEWFDVSGKCSIEEVREAHFKCINVLNFDIGDICSDCDERTIDPEIQEIIIQRGVVKADYFNDEWAGSIELVINLWIKILNYINPNLDLKLEEPTDKTINFYGYDNQGRHLNTPGYGLF